MSQILEPPPIRPLQPARLRVIKEVLLVQVRAERGRPTYRRQRRRLMAVLIPAAILGIAATGYTLLKPHEVVAAGIGCFDQPDLNGNVTVVSATGEGPKAVCSRLWTEGVVMHGANDAPPLVACANEGGAVLVFPSTEQALCSELGLQNLPAGYEEAAARFVKMRDAVIRELFRSATAGSATAENACLSQQEALAIVQRVLEDEGFSDWSVEVATGDYQGRRCGNEVAFDDRNEQILIIPSSQGIDPNPFGPH